IRDLIVTGVQTCALPISEGLISKYLTAHSTKWMTLACVMTTPLGIPVEPEVNRMCAGSRRVVRETRGVTGWLRTSSIENAIRKRSEERRVGKEGRCGWGE